MRVIIIVGIITYLSFTAPAAFAVIGPEPSAGTPTDYNAPSLPSNVKLVSDGVKVSITWTDPPEADFYRLEFLRNDGGDTEVTGNVRVRTAKGVERYEDAEVVSGQSYKYRLRVSDLYSNTRLSDEYSVAVVAPAPESTVTTAPAPTTITAPAEVAAPPASLTLPTPSTPSAASTPAEELRGGTFAYGYARVRALSTEQGLAKALAAHLESALPGVFNRLFHQSTVKSKSWWYTYVNAYVYGGYTFDEIVRAVKLGGKVVHPSIPASSWRGSADYQTYIAK